MAYDYKNDANAALTAAEVASDALKGTIQTGNSSDTDKYMKKSEKLQEFCLFPVRY